APKINYSLPRGNEIPFHNIMPFPLDPDIFETPPEPPPLEETADQIADEIIYALQTGLASKYIKGSASQLRGLIFIRRVGGQDVYYSPENNFAGVAQTPTTPTNTTPTGNTGANTG